MNMVYFKFFIDWNPLFEAFPPDAAGKLIKAIAYFTDDLKENQTLEIDERQRIGEALKKAGLDADPVLSANAEMICRRLYREFATALKKSETNADNGSDGVKKRWLDKYFAELWAAYPKKVGEEKARAEFSKSGIDAEGMKELRKGLERWQKSAQWQDAQFIPDLANWIKDKKWLDEPPKPSGKKNAALNYKQTELKEEDFDALVVNLDGE